jgi:hypothetical protein
MSASEPKGGVGGAGVEWAFGLFGAIGSLGARRYFSNLHALTATGARREGSLRATRCSLLPYPRYPVGYSQPLR